MEEWAGSSLGLLLVGPAPCWASWHRVSFAAVRNITLKMQDQTLLNSEAKKRWAPLTGLLITEGLV